MSTNNGGKVERTGLTALSVLASAASASVLAMESASLNADANLDELQEPGKEVVIEGEDGPEGFQDAKGECGTSSNNVTEDSSTADLEEPEEIEMGEESVSEDEDQDNEDIGKMYADAVAEDDVESSGANPRDQWISLIKSTTSLSSELATALPKKKRNKPCATPSNRKGRKHKSPIPRPYNRYNLFFTLERHRFLQSKGIPSINKDDLQQPSNNHHRHGYHNLNLPPLPPRYANVVLPKDWCFNTSLKKNRNKRRSHSKTHGESSFQNLAQRIAHEWKNVDKEAYEYVGKVEEIIFKRYKILLKLCEQAIKQSKEDGGGGHVNEATIIDKYYCQKAENETNYSTRAEMKEEEQLNRVSKIITGASIPNGYSSGAVVKAVTSPAVLSTQSSASTRASSSLTREEKSKPRSTTTVENASNSWGRTISTSPATRATMQQREGHPPSNHHGSMFQLPYCAGVLSGLEQPPIPMGIPPAAMMMMTMHGKLLRGGGRGVGGGAVVQCHPWYAAHFHNNNPIALGQNMASDYKSLARSTNPNVNPSQQAQQQGNPNVAPSQLSILSERLDTLRMKRIELEKQLNEVKDEVDGIIDMFEKYGCSPATATTMPATITTMVQNHGEHHEQPAPRIETLPGNNSNRNNNDNRNDRNVINQQQQLKQTSKPPRRALQLQPSFQNHSPVRTLEDIAACLHARRKFVADRAHYEMVEHFCRRQQQQEQLQSQAKQQQEQLQHQDRQSKKRLQQKHLEVYRKIEIERKDHATNAAGVTTSPFSPVKEEPTSKPRFILLHHSNPSEIMENYPKQLPFSKGRERINVVGGAFANNDGFRFIQTSQGERPVEKGPAALGIRGDSVQSSCEQDQIVQMQWARETNQKDERFHESNDGFTASLSRASQMELTRQNHRGREDGSRPANDSRDPSGMQFMPFHKRRGS